jgi:hypothetical protein
MPNFARHFSWIFTAFALLLPRPAQAQSKPAADLIITNAKIWTVDPSPLDQIPRSTPGAAPTQK